MRILLVEHKRSAATSCIGDAHTIVECAEDADETLSLLKYDSYDLIVVGPGFPAPRGFEVIRRVRASRDDTPILSLTGPRIEDRAKALSLGADDAIADPIDPVELRARITSILRRSRGFSQSLLQIGELTLCLDDHTVQFRGKPIRLTPKESAVLELLALRRGQVVTKSTFMSQLYSGAEEPEGKIVDVFVCKLRKKLERAGAGGFINTAWGRGYVMVSPLPLPHPASLPELAPTGEFRLVA